MKSLSLSRKSYINTQLLKANMLESPKRHVKYAKEETIAIFICSLISAFVLSFSDWGTKAFDFNVGIRNLILTAIIVLVSLMIKFSVQKYFCRIKGYEVRFKPWYIGYILGILFIFATNGNFIFLAFGGLVFSLAPQIKFGERERSFSFSEMGWLSMLGPVSHLTLALIGKLLSSVPLFGEYSIAKFIYVNLWFTIFSMVPLPFIYKFNYKHSEKISEFGTSDGLKMFFGSPMQYTILLVIFFLNAFAILLVPFRYVFTLFILSAIVIYLVYRLFYKHQLRRQQGDKIFQYR